MKAHLRKLFVILFSLLMPFILQAEIFEIKNINALNKYIKPDMLVIFDIDNTLIEPIQELGTTQWFKHRIMEYRSYGFDKNVALEKALREWTAIQSITQVKVVEKETAEIIQNLQLEGFPIMGLTTRGLGLSTRTIEQLESVNIHLSETAPTQEEIFFMNERGVLFRGGTLFTAGTNKGNALIEFFNRLNYSPSSILFINDNASHLRSLEEACFQKDISFIGLRYGYLDEKVKNFRKQIAEVQFYFFGHILSDQAAERILHES